MIKFFTQYDFLKNFDRVFYQELTNLCEVLFLGPGDILLVVNINFVLQGKINIKDKKTRKVQDTLGRGSLICADTLLKPNDPHYKATRLM